MGRIEKQGEPGQGSHPRAGGRRRGWGYLAGVLALLWGTAVFLGYYYTHKPIRPENAAALGKVLLTLAAWSGTLITAHRLGGLFGSWLRHLPMEVRFPLQIGIGMGGIGLLTLLLGALGAYYPIVFWVLLLAGTLLGIRGFGGHLRNADFGRPQGTFQSLVRAFVVLMVAISFVRSLAPPVAWDSLVYHLTGPKLYLEAHGLHHDLDLPYLGFPGWGKMLFTWALALAGPGLAQLLHFTFMLLTLSLTVSLTRRLVSDLGWVSLAVLLSAPSLILLASWAYVEWLTLFTAVASLWVLLAGELRSPEDMLRVFEDSPEIAPGQRRLLFLDPMGKDGSERSQHSMLLVGLLAGLAFSAKYTTIGLVLGLAVLVLIRRRSGRDLVYFAAGLGLMVAPYLMKNWILTRNPVYPFFLPGKYWDPHRAFWYSRAGTGLALADILLAPWDATVWGVEGGAFEGHPAYGASIGPLLLTLIPLASLYWYRSMEASRRVVAGMLVICLSVFLQWLAMLAFSELLVQTRLMFMIFPLVATLGTLGLEGLRRVSRRGLRADFVLRALILLSLGLMAIGHLMSFLRASPLPVITGNQTVGDYLLERLGGHYLAMERINQLPESSQITFLWEPRSYYCSSSIHCQPDALLDRWWHLRQHGLSAAEVADRWRQEGTTHVLFYSAGANAVRVAGFDPLDESDWAELERLLDRELQEVIGWENGYKLYRLRSGE
jgi:hypothetical protein